MLIKPELSYIKEPELSFGYGQKTSDPRDGLMLYGAFDKDKIKGQINIGIIGATQQREYLKEYLKIIHKPIHVNSDSIARPFFAGLEAVFGIHINFENIVEINVSSDEINKFLHYTDGHQRVHNLSNLYSTELIKYSKQEEKPVTVWFVVIPDDIYKYGRPKSKLPKSAENIKIGLNKKRDKSQTFLFDELTELQEAYDYEINFHNQLKAKLLDDKIVTQIIKESTIAYESLWIDQKKINDQKIFDTAKAWNISTTLYYKAGGLPWRLGDVREDVCYLGLVYKKLDNDKNNRSACCAAQMFIDSGDGMVFRGNIGDWFNPVTKEFHISKKDAINLINHSLEAFKEKLGKGNYPKEIFIHAKTYFDEEEWEGFLEAVQGKSKIIGVRIQATTGEFKLYRDFSFCVPRGMMIKVATNKAFLWTKGFITRLQTQIGLETPNPISVEVTRGDADIQQVCKDVLALTKLNYNACIFADGQPVTLRFADSIGEVLTAGKNITSDVLPFKHYV